MPHLLHLPGFALATLQWAHWYLAFTIATLQCSHFAAFAAPCPHLGQT
jgi:hypothetical protein